MDFDEKDKNALFLIGMPFLITLIFILLVFLFSSCTLSFQNISTHGTATDLIDENLDAKADISAQAQGVPI